MLFKERPLTIFFRWVWLGTVLPIQNITGEYLTFIMMTYSFIADNSNQRERMIRIGLCSFSLQIARPLSYPIGAVHKIQNATYIYNDKYIPTREGQCFGHN